MSNKLLSPNQTKSKTRQVCVESENCVKEFIENVWNKNDVSEILSYTTCDFVDHAMPFKLLQNKKGLLHYLKKLNQDVWHHTRIIRIVTIGDLVVVYIQIFLELKTGRPGLSSEREILNGIRVFRMIQNKIKEHWEIIC